MLPFLPFTGGNPPDGYQISRSLRFRANNGAYLTRTPASAGTGAGRTWTWSGWVKRGVVASSGIISIMHAQSAPGAADRGGFGFYANSGGGVGSDCLTVYHNASFANNVTTTAVFRDPLAWYHVVIAVDTTQATASNRVRIYINGTLITAMSATNYPAQNYQFAIGRNIQTWISSEGGGAYYFDGYLADVHFIDGQSLDASYFGQTEAMTGVWSPKKYTGTFGTNGFHLDFADNSAATATAIGKDTSGNGNNWTPTGISVSAGVANDSLVDNPMNYGSDTGIGGTVRGNYATLNPLKRSGYANVANANLTLASTTATAWGSVVATIPVSSGKWYWELTAAGSDTAPLLQAGIALVTWQPENTTGGLSLGTDANSWAYFLGSGQKGNSDSYPAFGPAFAYGDVMGVALDLDAGTLTFYRNGSSLGVAYTGLSGTFVPTFSAYNAGLNVAAVNFGQRPFTYTAPAGFKALCTQNLPDPSITKPSQYFDATVYTGNGSSQSITNTGGFQPDLVWIKSRGGARSHCLVDSARGATKYLSSDLTDAEATSAGSVTSFNSGGFSVGGALFVNNSVENYASWQWDEGVTPGFDIVTYTGDGIAGKQVAHSLGVTPAFMFGKRRDGVGGEYWNVYHRSLGAANIVFLNRTDAAASNNFPWNSNVPTSTYFVLGSGTNMNAAGSSNVAYLWAEVPGFSRFGSYTGNGSADGPFVWCGFRPRYVVIKRTDAVGEWMVFDTARNSVNLATNYILANAASAEAATTGGNPIDILSNGFKLRGTDTVTNASGGNYIFAAFAEHPFKYARAR